jgi:hypothetical protein
MKAYDFGMRSGGTRPSRFARLAGPAIAVVAFVVLLGAVAPAEMTESRLAFIDPGLEEDVVSPGLFDGFGVVLLVGLAIAVVAALGAAFVLFRTRASNAPPPSSEGWWTCASCGAGNIEGAARCHACATWRSRPRPTPTT